ncbi:type 4a pilus biogenesis protein PilO [Cohnella fermenti]|nr:type 4a pilus biogenesis protein PilO [Cohnella fermenti]
MLQTATNKRTLGTLGILLLFVFLLGFYFLQVNPLTGDIKKQEDEVSRLQKQSDLLTKKLNEKLAEKGSENMDEIQKALPLWDNTEQLLMDLNKIGSAVAVKTSSVTFSASESNELQTIVGGEQSPYPTVHELKTSVVLQGTYEQLLAWFDRLQQMERLTNIDSFTLAQPTTAEEKLKPITISVSLTAYFDPSYSELVTEVLEPF